jgi:hypothetical protein
MSDREENEEWRNYSVKEYPRIEPWVHVAGLAIIGTGIGLGMWMGHGNIGFFGGIVACFILVLVANPVRCPQCKRQVSTRDIEYEHGYRQFFHDCSKCRITWECKVRRVSDS